MVITILEAGIPSDRLANAEVVFREGMKELPDEIIESFFVRDENHSNRFRLVTVWRSMEALLAMRQSGVKPKGVQMFEEVGAKPELSIFDVVVHATHTAQR